MWNSDEMRKERKLFQIETLEIKLKEIEEALKLIKKNVDNLKELI